VSGVRTFASLFTMLTLGAMQMAFCVSIRFLCWLSHPPHMPSSILEMQVILSELVGTFSFALPDNDSDPVRVRVANTLVPTMSNGQKGVPLHITRLL
jgi:hypothetical protein